VAIIRKIGGKLASGKNLENFTHGIGDAIGNLGHNIVESQRIRHESARLREQQEFLSSYRAAEAQHREASAEADFRRARDTSEHQAALDTAAADRAHRHHLEQAAHRAWCEVLVSTELLKLKIDQTNTPFSYEHERIRADALHASRGRQRPVLLIAPFFSDSTDSTTNDARPTELLFPLHHAWDRQPWCEDMGRLTGVFRRPLRMLDVDLLTIRRLLGDVPTVLVFGEIESDHRLWVNVIGWSLAPELETTDNEAPPDQPIAAEAFRLVLPPVELPDGDGPNNSRKHVVFRDEVAAEALLFAELYAEWFHVGRGRTPSFHCALPEAAMPLRGAIAVVSAAMLDLAVERDRIDPVEAAIAQARTYMEGERPDRALTVARRCAGELRTADRFDAQLFLDRVRRVTALLHELGDDTEARLLDENARPTARNEILRRTPWGA
jgi:hypothetical protein